MENLTDGLLVELNKAMKYNSHIYIGDVINIVLDLKNISRKYDSEFNCYPSNRVTQMEFNGTNRSLYDALVFYNKTKGKINE